MIKRIFTNIFSNWANLAVNIAISFFLAPFVVEKLGNTYYGIWVIMMQFTGYLYLLDFGVRESIIRYVSKGKADGKTEDLNEIISSGIILYGGIGFICLLASAGLALAFPYVFNIDTQEVWAARIVVIISGVTVAQLLVFNVFSGILMGLQRYDIFNKIGIIFAFIRLGLILYFLGNGYSLIALALIQLFIGLGTNLTIYFSSKRILRENKIPFKYTKIPFKDRFPVFRKLYNYSKYVLINNLGQKAIFYTDAIIIGVIMSAASVTFYAIAGNLIEYLRKLVLQAADVLNPVASELDAKNDSSKLSKLVLNGSKFTMCIALPISIIYYAAGSHFIELWMGEEYAELSGQVLAILSITVLLTTPHLTLSSVLYGISKHHLISNLRIIEAIFNLFFSIILAINYGIVGVALGTAIPQLLIMGIILPVLVAKHIDYSLSNYVYEVYIRPFMAVVPFYLSYNVVSGWLYPENLLLFFIEIAACLPVYAFSVFMFCLDRPEKEKSRVMVRNLAARLIGK